MSLRIVFYQFVAQFGGADRCTIEFASRLKEFADVHIVDPYGSSDTYRKAVAAAGIPYHVVWQRSSRRDIGGWGNPMSRALHMAGSVPHMLRLAHRTAALMDRLKPSVISTHNFRAAMVLAMHRRLRRVPVCYYLHNWYRPPQMDFLGRMLCRHHATGILGVSYSTLQACICAGIQWNKIDALYNPIDVEEMERRGALPLEAPLPQAHRQVRLLLPAGLLRVKGHKVAVRALRHILDRGHDAVLWLAGEGQPVGPNRTYIEEIHQVIREVGAKDRVEFLGLRNDMPQVMKAATILVLPSVLEGHPRVIVEGMAMKRPFIATPAGGCLDMLSPGLTGYLMRFDDPRDLADCVDRVVTEPCNTQRMVETAYDWVKREFTPAEHTRKLLAFYQAVAERRL